MTQLFGIMPNMTIIMFFGTLPLFASISLRDGSLYYINIINMLLVYTSHIFINRKDTRIKELIH